MLSIFGVSLLLYIISCIVTIHTLTESNRPIRKMDAKTRGNFVLAKLEHLFTFALSQSEWL